MSLTNITPEDALEITALPYNESFDPTGTTEGSYNSTCQATHAYNALWFKYTAKANENFLAVTAYCDIGGANYVPYLSVWTGVPPAMTQFTIAAGDAPEFCDNLDSTVWFNIPVVPGDTYYFLVVNGNNTTPLGGNLVLQVNGPAYLNAPVGSLVISDDTDGFPAAVFSATTGEFLRWLDYPAGEFAAVLPTGERCVQNLEDPGTGVAIYDATMAFVASHDFGAGNEISIISSDYDSTFYVVTTNGATSILRTITKSGVVGGTTWVLAHRAFAGSVDRSGSKFYYSDVGSGSTIIYVHDLNTDTGSTFKTAIGTEWIVGYGTGFVDASGSIWFAYGSDGLGSTPKLREFNTSGTVLNTFNLATGSYNQTNRWVAAPDADDAIWAWDLSGYFYKYSLVDGSLLTALPQIQTSGSSGENGNPFAISNSCPVSILAVALSLPASTGTPFSGIYKLEIGKTSDSVYLDPVSEDEAEFKIPEPFADTALLGDE